MNLLRLGRRTTKLNDDAPLVRRAEGRRRKLKPMSEDGRDGSSIVALSMSDVITGSQLEHKVKRSG